jgi:hypothetical protein
MDVSGQLHELVAYPPRNLHSLPSEWETGWESEQVLRLLGALPIVYLRK